MELFDDLLSYDPSDSKVFDYLDTHYEIIKYVLENKEQNYYYWVGAYPNLKSSDLAMVEKITQQYMVSGLLRNPNVSGEWLSKKIKSTDLSIAQSAASHKNLPLKEFKKLDKMENKLMIRAMLSNPSCPSEYLEKFFYADEEENIFTKEKSNLATVMNNPNLPIELFKQAIENHNEYYKYIDGMLAKIKITPDHTKALDLKYPKKSTYFDRMILQLSDNPGCKTNKVLQDFLTEKIYQEYDNNYKEKIMKAIGQYIDVENIKKLMKKLTTNQLTELLKNPNTPVSNAKYILMNAKVVHIGEIYDGYDFSDDDLVNIVFRFSDVAHTPNRGERFFDKYKHKFNYDVLNRLYSMTQNEKYLSQEAKDIFLF